MSVAADIVDAVSGGDVLAGLEEIDWAGLRHAYGPAGDVPGVLRALASGPPADRKHALTKLYGNIFHQGSRYEATAYAVPFLARLALDRRRPHRDAIVHLLVALALGYDEAYLPGGVDIAGWRAGVERMRSADSAQRLRELDAWVEAARDEADRRVRGEYRAVDDPAAALRSALDELAAYDAVRAEVPRLRGLLGDGDPRVRAAVAYLVGWFPQEAPGSVSALRVLLAAEARPGVAATAVVSAGLLGDTGLIPRLRKGLGGPEPLVRWADAIALARLGIADAEVTGVLAAACVEPPEPGPEPAVRFLGGNLRGYAAQTLAALDGRLPPSALDAVLDGLARASGTAAFPVTAAALRLAFPRGAPHPLPPYHQLAEPQQRVVRTLAGLEPDIWRWGNFMLILRAWNLPSAHGECRAYAGLGAP
jgi:HEAT repeat protein